MKNEINTNTIDTVNFRIQTKETSKEKFMDTLDDIFPNGIRSVTDNGIRWYCLKDICGALGLRVDKVLYRIPPNMCMKRLDKRVMWYVTAEGMYEVARGNEKAKRAMHILWKAALEPDATGNGNVWDENKANNNMSKNPDVGKDGSQDTEDADSSMNQNEIVIFSKDEFGEIRTILIDGKPWFVAVDICRALELSNTSRALAGLDEDERMTLTLSKGHSGQRGGAQSMNIINDFGLYTLILRSRKPEAKRFKRWITHEVIPSIRTDANDNPNNIVTLFGVDCYEKDGIAYLKLGNVAKGLGFTQTQNKNRTEYVSIRWERIKQYLDEIGFPPQVGEEITGNTFIPENIFYRLAMKAKSETAEKFQALVADEIMPALRKTGTYTYKQQQKQQQSENEMFQQMIVKTMEIMGGTIENICNNLVHCNEKISQVEQQSLETNKRIDDCEDEIRQLAYRLNALENPEGLEEYEDTSYLDNRKKFRQRKWNESNLPEDAKNRVKNAMTKTVDKHIHNEDYRILFERFFYYDLRDQYCKKFGVEYFYDIDEGQVDDAVEFMGNWSPGFQYMLWVLAKLDENYKCGFQNKFYYPHEREECITAYERTLLNRLKDQLEIEGE